MITIDLSNRAQGDLDAVLHQDIPLEVKLVGRGPLNLSGWSVNRTRKLKVYGAEALITGLDVSVRYSDHLCRNIVLEDLTVDSGFNARFDGGAQKTDRGWESIYNMQIVRLVIERGTLQIGGGFFESEVDGANIIAPRHSFGLSIADNVPSSLEIRAMKVRNGARSECFAADVHFVRCTFLESEQEGLFIDNNIYGSVRDCHFELTNQEVPGACLKVVTKVNVDNASCPQAGPHTTHVVEGYTGGNWGSVRRGEGPPGIPYLKRNSIKIVRLPW